MPDGLSDVSRRMACGGIAGMVAKTVTNPLERVKMVAQTGEHKCASGSKANPYTIYRNIITAEGYIGLWAGNGANLLRVFPSKAVVFSSNDVYRKLLAPYVTNTTTASFLAGGFAGSTATAVTYPLDLARGRISGKVVVATGKVYKSVWSTVAVTLRDEGIGGLYRGVTATLIGAMPYMGIQFGTVGMLERHFVEEGENPTSQQKMMFGGCGGVAAGVITYPNDTVRRLLQLQGSRGTVAVYSGYWDCVRQTIGGIGIARLYQGVGINILRMAPNTAVQFGVYEVLKTWTDPTKR